jgi:hypothetical protein
MHLDVYCHTITRWIRILVFKGSARADLDEQFDWNEDTMEKRKIGKSQQRSRTDDGSYHNPLQQLEGDVTSFVLAELCPTVEPYVEITSGRKLEKKMPEFD